jgi:O-antigen/teichoic acid export membrane protein
LPNFIVSFFVFYKRVFYVFQKKTSKLNSAVKFEFSKKNIQVTLFAVFAMGVVQVDYIVMSQFLTNHEITNYSIISKLFILFFYIYTTILATLWPQLTYYYSLGKKEMIISSIKKALMFGFVLVVMSTLIFCYFNKEVLKLIAPDFDTALPIGLILLFGVYNLVRTWTDTFATFLQSSNKFSVLLYATPLQAMISVVTQILLVKQYGSFGIITGLIASFLLSVSWILPLKTHYILSKL